MNKEKAMKKITIDPVFDEDGNLVWFDGESYYPKARCVELLGAGETTWTELEYVFRVEKVKVARRVYFRRRTVDLLLRLVQEFRARE